MVSNVYLFHYFFNAVITIAIKYPEIWSHCFNSCFKSRCFFRVLFNEEILVKRMRTLCTSDYCRTSNNISFRIDSAKSTSRQQVNVIHVFEKSTLSGCFDNLSIDINKSKKSQEFYYAPRFSFIEYFRMIEFVGFSHFNKFFDPWFKPLILICHLYYLTQIYQTQLHLQESQFRPSSFHIERVSLHIAILDLSNPTLLSMSWKKR